MPLKLGGAACTSSWDFQVEGMFQHVAGLGFAYVEGSNTLPHLWPRGMNKQERKRLNHILDALHLRLVSWNLNPGDTDLNLASINAGIRQECVHQLQETIALAHDLNCGIVVVPAGALNPIVSVPFETAWGWAKQGIQECEGDAARYGVTLALENTDSYKALNRPGILRTARLMKRMVEEIGSEHVRLTYDVTNAPKSEDLPAAIRELSQYLALVHVSDNTDEKDHLPVGAGNIDFESVAHSLEGIHFDGCSILEVGYSKGCEQDMTSSISKLEACGWAR